MPGRVSPVSHKGHDTRNREGPGIRETPGIPERTWAALSKAVWHPSPRVGSQERSSG